jgi:predicted metallo-beta-lactamase superfamily hydrolase
VRVIPLAAESLGVRSMATYVEVAGRGILIDPGATLAAGRQGLPPAGEEWEALRRANDRISAYATRAEFVFVSHYHEDHFRSDPASYAGHTVLLKDARRMIGGLQARRASALWEALTPHARVQAADGFRWDAQDIGLEVSAPLAHGREGTPLGYVLALTVHDPAERQRFVFASDVQGPLSAVGAAYLIRQRPTLLYLSGPPSYIESEVGTAAVEQGIDHLLRILDATGCRVIMDHHALRDARFATRFARLWQSDRVTTAAGHLGLPVAPLESRRAVLWAASRRPAAKAGAERATISRTTRKSAKGGGLE